MNNPGSPLPLLAIDAGNSRLKFGLFEPGRLSHSNSIWPECREFLAVHVDDAIPWETLAEWTVATGRQSAISGTNPRAVERLLKGWARHGWPAPFVVNDFTAVPVTMDVDFPEKVGLDRLLAAVAANALRPADRAAIVIDSGTATTVNYVSTQGTFCGGAILPGLEMSAKALNHYTALLPLLPVYELGGDEPVAPGRNTREAIRNGLLWGQVGAIRELVRQLCLRRGHDLPFDSSQRPWEYSKDILSKAVDFVPENKAFQEQLRGVEEKLSRTPWLVLTGGGGPVLSPHFPDVMRLASLGMHGLVLTAWGAGPRKAS